MLEFYKPIAMAKARCNYAPVVFDAFTETAFCFRQSNSLTRFHWVDKQARDNANLLVAFRSALFPKQNSGSNYNSGRQREEKNFRVGSRHSQGMSEKGLGNSHGMYGWWECNKIVHCARLMWWLFLAFLGVWGRVSRDLWCSAKFLNLLGLEDKTFLPVWGEDDIAWATFFISRDIFHLTKKVRIHDWNYTERDEDNNYRRRTSLPPPPEGLCCSHFAKWRGNHRWRRRQNLSILVILYS